MKAEELSLRENIISLHKKNKSTREIAYLLDITKSKAAFWVKRFNDVGSLKNRPRSGRPTPLTKKQLRNIAGELKARVLEAEGKAGISSKEVLELMDQKVHKKYSLRHVQRLLHRIGFSLITPRPQHRKKDEEAQERFRKGFKKDSNEPMWGIPSSRLTKQASV